MPRRVGPGATALFVFSGRLFLLIALAAWSVCGQSIQSLSKRWEIDLHARIADLRLPASDNLTVYWARFSPDSSRVAVLFGSEKGPDGLFTAAPTARTALLLVVPVEHPETTIYRADLSGSVDGRYLAWAPDGNSIIAGGVLIRLPGGEQCRPGQWIQDSRWTPVFGGFLSEGRALFAVPDPAVRKGLPPSILVAVGPDCAIRGRWPSKDQLEIRGTGGRYIAVRAYEGGSKRFTNDTLASARFLLLEPGSPKQVRLSLPAHHFAGRNAVFTDDDTQVCAAVQRPSARPAEAIFPPGEGRSMRPSIEARIHCWDMRTGKRTRQSRYIWRETPGMPLARLVLTGGGGRIAVSDGGPLRTVWDVEADRVLAWTRQTDPTFQGTQPFVISPDGKLVLESGPGSLRVSQLP